MVTTDTSKAGNKNTLVIGNKPIQSISTPKPWNPLDGISNEYVIDWELYNLLCRSIIDKRDESNFNFYKEIDKYLISKKINGYIRNQNDLEKNFDGFSFANHGCAYIAIYNAMVASGNKKNMSVIMQGAARVVFNADKIQNRGLTDDEMKLVLNYFCIGYSYQEAKSWFFGIEKGRNIVTLKHRYIYSVNHAAYFYSDGSMVTLYNMILGETPTISVNSLENYLYENSYTYKGRFEL